MITEDIKNMFNPIYELRQTTYDRLALPILHTNLAHTAEGFKNEISELREYYLNLK